MLLTIALLALSFVLILAGAFAFTNAVEWAGARLGLGHGAVGSVLAAVATALPESTIPSSLALGNITGAMVFQTAIPVAIGLLFVPWRLAPGAIVAVACALIGGALALGIVWRTSRFTPPWLAAWLALYGGGLAYLFVTA